MMKHVYIFQALSRSASYGIGSYIEQLLYVVKELNLRLTVVRYYSSHNSVVPTIENGVRYIDIPRPEYHDVSLSEEESVNRYGKALTFALIPFVDTSEENVFHLNYSNEISLAKHLKCYFDCTVIKTVHYTLWSLQLTGDRKQLIKLLRQDIDLLNPSEQTVIKSFQIEKETMIKYCDRVIAISQHSYKDLLNLYGLDKEKVFLVPNALKDVTRPLPSKKREKMRVRFGMKENDISIVFAGRLDKIKGIFVLIKALELVLNSHQNVRLYVAGDGVVSQLFHRGIKVCSNISYTGFLSKEDLYVLYNASDIGVVPSIHEEFGYVAIEMMMHGLPVIVSNSTGLAEIVEHEVSGLRTSISHAERSFTQSARNLADNILRLINDPELRKTLASEGRQRYKSKYDIGPFIKRMGAIYDLPTSSNR